MGMFGLISFIFLHAKLKNLSHVLKEQVNADPKLRDRITVGNELPKEASIFISHLDDMNC